MGWGAVCVPLPVLDGVPWCHSRSRVPWVPPLFQGRHRQPLHPPFAVALGWQWDAPALPVVKDGTGNLLDTLLCSADKLEHRVEEKESNGAAGEAGQTCMLLLLHWGQALTVLSTFRCVGGKIQQWWTRCSVVSLWLKIYCTSSLKVLTEAWPCHPPANKLLMGFLTRAFGTAPKKRCSA